MPPTHQLWALRSQSIPSLTLNLWECVCVCVCMIGEDRVFLSICTGMENPSKKSGPGKGGQQLLPVMEGREYYWLVEMTAWLLREARDRAGTTTLNCSCLRYWHKYACWAPYQHDIVIMMWDYISSKILDIIILYNGISVVFSWCSKAAF